MARFFTIVLLLFYGFVLSSQDTIRIKNSSFEGEAHQGGSLHKSASLVDWNIRGSRGAMRFTKGQLIFIDNWVSLASHEGNSPVDVHSAETNFWNVDTKPFNGNNFVGMVTRKDNSFEAIGQELERPLKKDSTYQFSIYLCRSKTYKSPTMDSQSDSVSFAAPVHLSVWGIQASKEDYELLAVSPLVANTNWKKFRFTIKPENNIEVLILQATFHDADGEPYCGNILLDMMSDIIMVPNNNTE
jgi:hypothetical protein